MKNKSIVLFVILFVFGGLFFTSESTGEKGSKIVAYNKDTVITVKGKVSSIDIVLNKAMQEEGLHLTIDTDKSSYIIHVCPKWYADKTKISFEIGNEITVTGSEFDKDDAKNIYAATIVTSSKKLELRDVETGNHLWKGRYQDSNKGKKNKKSTGS